MVVFLAMGNDDDADDGHVVKGRVKFLSAVYFFSRKQRSFLHILQVYTHLNVNFLHNSSRIYIFCTILTKRVPNY